MSQGTASPNNNQIPVIAGWFIVIGASYCVLLGILAGPHFFGHKVEVGDIVEHNIFATRKAFVVDEPKTKEARERVRGQVSPVLTRDTHLSNKILTAVEERLTAVTKLQAHGQLLQKAGMPAAETAKLMQMSEPDFQKALHDNSSAAAKLPALKYPEAARALEDLRRTYQALAIKDANAVYLALAVKPEATGQLLADVKSACKRFLYKVALHPYDDPKEWETVLYEFLPDKLDSSLRTACVALAAPALRPNVTVDESRTRQKTEKALAAVKPVMRELEIGQLIVGRDEPITPTQMEALTALGMTNQQNRSLAAGLAVALLTAFGLFGIFLYQYAPKLLLSPSALALMSTMSILVCGSALFLGDQLPQLVPLPAATLILSVTYGRRLAAVLSLLVIIFLGVSDILEPPYLMALTAAAATAAMTSIKRRRDLMLTGLLIGFMQTVGYFIAVMLGLSLEGAVNLGRELPMQMLGGLISSILAIGGLPILESIFGILTPYRVAELADPDQPLMRQLEENAPGTYQHSLAVANLAEGGARAIGADVYLCRTGAMYHDIGKMVTPRYFIENQLGDKNPHDFMAPEESKDKVLAHVTNGLALAAKHGLPKAVQAFIPEHQGTTIMAYFYHKACLRDGKENVDTNLYRYPGPKPQTRESAIVMLADVSEAVTHSMKNPTQEEVETAITGVFKARWDDGQFTESTLSYEELEKVKTGFVRVWRTLHHDRLKYPSTTTGRMPVPPQQDTGGAAGEASEAPPSPAPDGSAAPAGPDCCSQNN